MRAQLSKQLKQFNKIAPNKEWVKSFKKELFFEFEEKSIETGFDFGHSGAWLFARSPAFLVSSGVLVAIIALVLVFGLPVFQGPTKMQLAEYEYFRVSLQELSSNLQGVSLQLKGVDTAEKVLAVNKEVEAALQQGEQLLAQAKEKTKNLKVVNGEKQKDGISGADMEIGQSDGPALLPEDEVLAALTDVENALSQMKEVSQVAQKEVAEREINNLRNSALTENQTALLEQAEEYFAQGSYPQALAKIVEISQNR